MASKKFDHPMIKILKVKEEDKKVILRFQQEITNRTFDIRHKSDDLVIFSSDECELRLKYGGIVNLVVALEDDGSIPENKLVKYTKIITQKFSKTPACLLSK